MNAPTYKIHGKERRTLKKELAELKSFVKNFWYCYQLEKDMHFIYGCDDKNVISNNTAEKKLEAAKLKITKLEDRLNTPYTETAK